MSNDIKRMDIKEFREIGFLQEANRLFFHPRGLALEVEIDDDGNEKLGGVWDCRDDPEGVYFVEGNLTVRQERMRNVQAELDKHTSERLKRFGSIIQPLGE